MIHPKTHVPVPADANECEGRNHKIWSEKKLCSANGTKSIAHKRGTTGKKKRGNVARRLEKSL